MSSAEKRILPKSPIIDHLAVNLLTALKNIDLLLVEAELRNTLQAEENDLRRCSRSRDVVKMKVLMVIYEGYLVMYPTGSPDKYLSTARDLEHQG